MNSRAAPLTVMFAKFLLPLVVVCTVACSGTDHPNASGGAAGSVVSGGAGTGGTASGGAGPGGGGSTSVAGTADDGSLIYPANLTVLPRVGINSVFNVIALTLRPTSDGMELLAAVRNDGEILACNASFSVDLHDRDDEIVASNISGLNVRRFYELNDGSGQLAGCLAPGDVTMVTIPSLTLNPPDAEIQSVVYQSNYWGNLDISPVAGINLSGVQSVARAAGVAFTGTLRNDLARELPNPTVAVFTLNSAGRPLEVAYGASTAVLPAGGSWDFETSTVKQSGVNFDAYPMGGS
ncbi:MAG TPA: FxLYD domain-containing protein [Polyangiaceae bacterium]|nr:FxLYD domain-containing protein [Polyangiaceae bacterium]